MTQNSCAVSPSQPAPVCYSLNRCDLPSTILAGLTYQQHPIPLHIDGVSELHRDFFRALADIRAAEERAIHFRQYMCSAFLLGQSELAGFSHNNSGIHRNKADYLRLLRGWMFNADGIEGAVMKRWVESRFGLRTLNHGGQLLNHTGKIFEAYQADYVRGLYNSNALESQLDLLYTYCQYELQRQWPEQTHRRLYRAMNHINKHAQMSVQLNNLNSFSSDRYLVESFGDVIFEMDVPTTKLVYFPELLPDVLKGEHEHLVLGGTYQAKVLS